MVSFSVTSLFAGTGQETPDLHASGSASGKGTQLPPMITHTLFVILSSLTAGEERNTAENFYTIYSL